MDNSEKYGVLGSIYDVVDERRARPRSDSYTSYLLSKGQNKVLQKLCEQAVGIALAAKDAHYSEVIHEAADLMYHLVVLLAMNHITIDDVEQELISRNNKSLQEIQANHDKV